MQKTCAEAKQDEIHVKQDTSTRISMVQLAEQRGVCAFSVHYYNKIAVFTSK